MQNLIDFFQTNSALVLANPIAFASSAVLFASCGFTVGRYFLAERIANLESRIARRDDQIEELKSRSAASKLEIQMVPVVGTTAIGENERPPLERWPDRRGNALVEADCAGEGGKLAAAARR
ncbi:hypothetical protein [Mesorhizobium huakuii]|uniref:Uncharacterized protein n=2 Tax=Mesorhizobium TaxID=68287 RepID=A0ABZ0VPK9_9HYPH|nr:hypothetical protein [Mesorhizobium huakuii]WQB99180.1 hypothetical protein U0R22_003353 [Mesorhizobium huakuii]